MQRLIRLQIGMLMVLFAGFSLLISCNANQRDNFMDADIQKIEELRNKHESSILTIDGVESISVGLCTNGNPCLQIGTSIPVNQIRPKLPMELIENNVELNGTKLSPAETSGARQLIEKEEGWLRIG